jgi:hypothetical protein
MILQIATLLKVFITSKGFMGEILEFFKNKITWTFILTSRDNMTFLFWFAPL